MGRSALKAHVQMTTILFNKPFDVLCQFTDENSTGGPRRNLSNFVDVPGVYPAGRLDRDSEGLLILTDDGKLQSKISHPKFKTPKTYFTQVEGIPDHAALKRLVSGVELKDGRTAGAKAQLVDEPDWLWTRNPPIRVRKTVPDSWIKLTISEGRNRQVRRMTAAVGHPTLRLIRWSISGWTLEDLAPGKWKKVSINR